MAISRSLSALRVCSPVGRSKTSPRAATQNARTGQSAGVVRGIQICVRLRAIQHIVDLLLRDHLVATGHGGNFAGQTFQRRFV